MATQRIKKAKAKISPKRSKKISAGEQNKINKGQRKINGALCYVDWHVIYSIKELIKALEDGGVLTEAKLKKAKKEAHLAHYKSERVAAIDPPGCDPALLIPKEPDMQAA